MTFDGSYSLQAPEAAKQLLLQEHKFKVHFDALTALLRKHEHVVANIPPVAAAMLRPHLEDLDSKLKPGLYVLTWASVSIQGFLGCVHAVCSGCMLICYPLVQAVPSCKVAKVLFANDAMPSWTRKDAMFVRSRCSYSWLSSTCAPT